MAKLLFGKIAAPATTFLGVLGLPGQVQTASTWTYPLQNHFSSFSPFIAFKSEVLTDLEKAANSKKTVVLLGISTNNILKK